MISLWPQASINKRTSTLSKVFEGRCHNYEMYGQLFLHFFMFQRGVMAAFWLCYRANTKHKHKNLVSFLALWFPFVPKEGFHAKCVEARPRHLWLCLFSIEIQITLQPE